MNFTISFIEDQIFIMNIALMKITAGHRRNSIKSVARIELLLSQTSSRLNWSLKFFHSCYKHNFWKQLEKFYDAMNKRRWKFATTASLNKKFPLNWELCGWLSDRVLVKVLTKLISLLSFIFVCKWYWSYTWRKFTGEVFQLFLCLIIYFWK